jgi:hypothetical protein
MTKPLPAPKVIDWLRHNEREIVVNPIIIGETQFGILLLPKSRRRSRLDSWFEAGIRQFSV